MNHYIQRNNHIQFGKKKFQSKIDDTLPQPYADEMRGLSDATGIPLGMLRYTLYILCE